MQLCVCGRGARAVARVVRNNPKLGALMAPTTLFTAFEAVDVNTHKREETRVAIAAAEKKVAAVAGGAAHGAAQGAVGDCLATTTTNCQHSCLFIYCC